MSISRAALSTLACVVECEDGKIVVSVFFK